MKAWDYECVTYDGDHYCCGCLPDGMSEEDEDAQPIFASDELDGPAVCCECGEVHDYMSIIGETG